MKTIILFLSIIISFNLVSQDTIVSKIPENRKAILEEFTGIYCSNCPDGHSISNSIAAANPGNFFAINIHPSSFPNFTEPKASSGDPDFRVNDGDIVANISSIPGLPSGNINRHLFKGQTGLAIGRTVWSSYADSIMAKPSYVNIGAKATIDSLSRVMTITVQGYFTRSGAPSSINLNIAMLQNNVKGTQTNGASNPAQSTSDGKYMHEHILRDMISPDWGYTINQTSKNTFFSKTYTYVIPRMIANVPVDIKNLDFITFVTEGETEIITGNKAQVTFDTLQSQYVDLALISASNTKPTSFCDTLFSSTVNVKNNSTTTIDSFNITISSENGAYDRLIVSTIAPGATQTITFDSYLNSDKSYKHLLYEVNFNGIPNNNIDTVSNNDTINTKYVFSTMPILPIGIIYKEDFEKYVNYSNVDNVIEKRLALNDGPADKKVYGVTPASEIGGNGASKKSYMVLLKTQPLGDTLQYIIKKLDFSKNTKHGVSFDYSYCQKTTTSNDSLQVVVSTDCGLTWTTKFSQGGLLLKTAPEQTASFAPSPTQWKKIDVSLTEYDGNPNVIIALRVINGGGNNLLFDNLYVYDNTIGIKPNSSIFSNVLVFPNPAKDILNVNFNKEKRGFVNISLINNLGQVVYSQNGNYEAGKNSIIINLNDIKKGIYYLKIADSNNNYTTKSVIVQ